MKILAHYINNLVVRIIAVTVDPIQSQRIFPYLLNQVLFTVSWPFSLMATLLITFYW